MAFPKGRLWRAHCVEISEERKIVKARKGLKPLVIRNKDAKNINNNVAFPKGRLWRAHCVHLQIGCKSKTNLLSTSINSDNLSRSNPCFVINNFNFTQGGNSMENFKKILTIILSISLLFAISCGDKPTGSDSGGSVIPSDYRNRYYKSENPISSSSGGTGYGWLYINNDGNIQYAQSANKPTSTDFSEPFKGSFSGNTFTSNEEGASITLKFNPDFSSVTVTVSGASEDMNGTYNQVE